MSIDINSARATKGADIEETALNTNLEAAEEIARQLRLRDLGGLIVIDFIDMNSPRNQREVENRLKELLKMDRARVQLGRISRFGLLEMSRQRLRPSLDEASHVICPRCNGQGTIRHIQSLALSVLRLIEEEAMKDRTARVVAQLPVKVATFLLNEKREALQAIENRHGVGVVIVPNETLDTPHFHLERQRLDELAIAGTTAPSYNLVLRHEETDELKPTPPVSLEEPMVKSVAPTTPAPEAAQPRTSEANPSFLKWLWSNLFERSDEQAQEESRESRPRREAERRRRGGRRSQESRTELRESTDRSETPTPETTREAGSESGPSAAPQPTAEAQETTQPTKDQSRTATEERGDEEETSGRSRRGRRGGRRRRRQESGAKQAGSEGEIPSAETPAKVDTAEEGPRYSNGRRIRSGRPRKPSSTLEGEGQTTGDTREQAPPPEAMVTEQFSAQGEDLTRQTTTGPEHKQSAREQQTAPVTGEPAETTTAIEKPRQPAAAGKVETPEGSTTRPEEETLAPAAAEQAPAPEAATIPQGQQQQETAATETIPVQEVPPPGSGEETPAPTTATPEQPLAASLEEQARQPAAPQPDTVASQPSQPRVPQEDRQPPPESVMAVPMEETAVFAQIPETEQPDQALFARPQDDNQAEQAVFAQQQDPEDQQDPEAQESPRLPDSISAEESARDEASLIAGLNPPQPSPGLEEPVGSEIGQPGEEDTATEAAPEEEPSYQEQQGEAQEHRDRQQKPATTEPGGQCSEQSQ